MVKEKRTAYFPTTIRAQSDETTEKLYIEGYFIRYGQETELFPNCFEEVRKGAATESIKNNDVRCLFNHDTGAVLGRTGNKTLVLTEDEKGVYGKVEINREDPQAMSLYAKIKRGDVDGCSFGFYIEEESHEVREDGTDKFYLEKVEVFEVSPVTFPAYPQTEIAARSKDLAALKQRHLASKKEKLKERLNHGN